MKSQVVDRSLCNFAVTTSLEDLIKGYILNCRCESKSLTTTATYDRTLKCFLWYCQENDYSNEPQKITPIHIRNFLWYLASEPNRWGSDNPASRKQASQSTINRYYRVLNTFFGWLKREELIPDNPVAHLKTPKLEKQVVQALAPKEVEPLLDQCPQKTYLGCRNRAIVMIFLDTGMRVSELANLNLDDVDMGSGSILIKHGKGGKQRLVRIGSRARKALWRYVTIYRRGNCDRLFLNRSGEPLDSTGTKLMIRRLGKKAGVHGVHAHRLRHTFAISFLRAGGDVFSLQYLLGHTTLQMTQRYLQSLNADDAMNAHRKFSPLDNMNLTRRLRSS